MAELKRRTGSVLKRVMSELNKIFKKSEEREAQLKRIRKERKKPKSFYEQKNK